MPVLYAYNNKFYFGYKRMQLFVVFKNQVTFVSNNQITIILKLQHGSNLVILTKDKIRTQIIIMLIMPLKYVIHNNNKNGQK